VPFDPSALRFAHPIRELVRTRISIRRYTGEPLSGPAREELERACSLLRRGPLGAECRFVLLELASRGWAAGQAPAGANRTAGAGAAQTAGVAPAAAAPAARPRRLGTYGMIRGARTFLAGAVRPADRALEDFAYLLELLVLKATDLDLGTCWLGGTFDRSAFARAIGLRKGELLPAVSPVGPSAQRRDLLERVIRFGAGSARRRPWAVLFFDSRWGVPLGTAEAGAYAEPLEALRLAPSASNRQPWRILRQERDGPFHLFLRRTPGYGLAAGSDLQRLDMGIAMAHFDLAAAEAGLRGAWTRLEEPTAPAGTPGLAGPQYIATWMTEAGS
jgi:nitroreductase